VTTVEASSSGDEVWIVALPQERVLVEEGPPDAEAATLARGIELDRPFRARAVRRGESTWVVAARRIETTELALDPGGTEVEVAFDGTERSVRVDGEPTLASIPELEALGARRAGAYVVRARRLEGRTWEVEVAAL
jgi:hypothetical protein